MRPTRIKPTADQHHLNLAQLLREGAILLDVRTNLEFSGFHITGAINIPYDELDAKKIEEIRQWNLPVITFSTYGRRSRIASRKLKMAGIIVLDSCKCRVVNRLINEE